MAWFVKTETFTAAAAALSVEQRRELISAHKVWIQKELAKGKKIISGYLVNNERKPGGGGLLIFEASCYEEAFDWIQDDPMLLSRKVDWKLEEWIILQHEP